MSIDWCKKAETGLPKPDAVFFLSLSPAALAQRGGFGIERYELTEIQTKARDNFMELADDTWQVRMVWGDIQKLFVAVGLVPSCGSCRY
jgi:dTMP kinase